METLKTSIFSFINKGILHVLITNSLSTNVLQFIDSLVAHFKNNHENPKHKFQFHNLKFSQENILHFHVTTATDVCMKEVIGSSHRRPL